MTILVITGMHRSGTSLTASWLQSCGLQIHDGEVWGPATGNPKGHFEDKAVVSFHTELVQRRAPTSKGWIIFPSDFLNFGDQDLERAKQIIQQRKDKYGTWGWKDPRTTLFLPEWKTLLPNLKIVILWRPPMEVASSLLKRSRHSNSTTYRIGFYSAVRLWKHYNILATSFKKKWPTDTILVPLHYLVHDDKAFFSRMQDKFGTSLQYRPLQSVFDSTLLHKHAVPVQYTLLGKLMNVGKIKRNLEQLTDFSTP